MTALVKHKGGCHCKAVTWEIEAPAELSVDECDCSMCEMIGFLHVIVPQSRFTLLTGKDNIATYTFNTGVAQHYFCKTCGIKSHYVPRSNPDGFSINFRCLDRTNVTGHTIVPCAGLTWEEIAARVAHLSKE
ncbi:hypothetical protein IWQ56_001051 [Coemansia nantahalensis]|uniref:Uncharacterized protein n=2 Tax=Coemansia TaxID=4863 RepID=A0ACC1LF27_9FUNG|nr:hypothetical protein IWQ57_005320 [Coemansia nantahalensis]KAJ2773285.1 hypothetical protein IWQ56_001051 [Coemansia nantahalensis]KAJ2807424.1 hypothetical protein H4R21_000482 [Coemansia helicoidea]